MNHLHLLDEGGTKTYVRNGVFLGDKPGCSYLTLNATHPADRSKLKFDPARDHPDYQPVDQLLSVSPCCEPLFERGKRLGEEESPGRGAHN